MPDNSLRPPVRTTFYFSDGISIGGLASVLAAISNFDARVSTLISISVFSPRIYGDTAANKTSARNPLKRAPKLSARVKAHEQLVDEFGTRPRLVTARFNSPGFMTVDGSGALAVLVRILQADDLGKDERRALIDRIQAETDLLHAKTKQKRIESLSATVAILKSVGVPDDEIVQMLANDKTLISLLGGPLACIETARTMGTLQSAALGPAQRDKSSDDDEQKAR